MVYETWKKVLSLLWEDDDRMEQDTLADLQEIVAEATLEAAEAEGKVHSLVQDFPWLYRVEPENRSKGREES